jgi:SOS-response transcriptional repressor LexA
MDLGTRLKQARQKKKLTQEDLASAIGIKQQAIQRIEAGKVKSTSYIVQMSRVLDVSPEWLALGDEMSGSSVVPNSYSAAKSVHHSLPLVEWANLSNLALAIQQPEKTIAAVSRISANSFATIVADESMHSSDGSKLGFHRNDILSVDTSRQPHDGDFVIAEHQGRMLFRQYINDGAGAYLRALNAHHESISCSVETKILGVVVNRITTFL